MREAALSNRPKAAEVTAEVLWISAARFTMSVASMAVAATVPSVVMQRTEKPIKCSFYVISRK